MPFILFKDILFFTFVQICDKKIVISQHEKEKYPQLFAVRLCDYTLLDYVYEYFLSRAFQQGAGNT